MQYVARLVILMAPVFVFLFLYSHPKKQPLSTIVNVYLVIIVGVSLFDIGKNVYENYHKPPEWDFLSFWLNGKVGLTGENFYDTGNYQKILLPYKPSDEFQKEIIDVGFWYPPFSMFLFLPFGLFNISVAYLFWQTLMLLLCVSCIYCLWRFFLKDYGILSLLLVATLMLRLVPTKDTFSFSQTNFLALLFFLLFWHTRSKERGGVWLALSVVVKPFMAVPYLYLLLARKWKIFAVAVLTLLTMALLTILVFSNEVFVTFFINNPTSKLPNYVYTEVVNQSLLATILRSNSFHLWKESLLSNPYYLGISLILTLITVLISIKNVGKNDGWVILSLLFFALLVYPATLTHYGVFLIVPTVLLLRQPGGNIKSRLVIFSIIFVVYLLSGNYVFFANLFMWLVCIAWAAKISPLRKLGLVGEV